MRARQPVRALLRFVLREGCRAEAEPEAAARGWSGVVAWDAGARGKADDRGSGRVLLDKYRVKQRRGKGNERNENKGGYPDCCSSPAAFSESPPPSPLRDPPALPVRLSLSLYTARESTHPRALTPLLTSTAELSVYASLPLTVRSRSYLLETLNLPGALSPV